MAENVIKPILDIDVGSGINNLKEFKQYIEACKGAMVGLDTESEEYKTIANEAATAQAKLNQVMVDSKSGTDAAAGSYNALTKEMSELKKAWKATSDEVERTNLGKQILDINNQLKTLDASTGNFQRSVGDYANAFEDAFKTCMGSLGQVSPELGKMGASVNSLVPMIKHTTQAATKGLSGVKKAIASTGIGALIIGVGLLITHFEDFRKAVGITDEKMSEFKSNVLGVLKNIVAGFVGVGNVILKYMLAPIKTAIEAFKGLGKVIEYVFTGQWGKIGDAANDAINSVKEAFSEGFDIKGNYEKGKKAGEDFINGIESNIRNGKIKAAAEKSAKELADAEMAELDKILERVEENSKTELQKLEEKYNQEKALLTKYGKDTTKLTQQYEAARGKIIQKQLDEEKAAREKALAEQKAKEEAYTKRVEDVETPLNNAKRKLEEAKDLWEEVQEVIKLGASPDSDNFYLSSEIQKALKDLGVSQNEWTLYVKETKKALRDAEIEVEILQTKYEKFMYGFRLRGLDTKNSEDNFDIENKRRIGTDLENEIAVANEKYAVNKQYYEDKIALLNQYIRESYTYNAENEDAILELVREREKVAEEYRRFDVQRENEVSKYKIALEKETLDAELERIDTINAAYQSFGSNIQDIFSSISDIIQSNMDLQEAQGKLTAEEANKKKKTLENLKKAELAANIFSIVGDAAAGITSVWRGYAAETGVINAETAAAAGPGAAGVKAALDAKSLTAAILKTSVIAGNASASITSAVAGTISSLNSMKSSSVSSASASATPSVEGYTPNYTENITNAEDTQNLANALTKAPIKAYVVESEITSAQKRSATREEEATW